MSLRFDVATGERDLTWGGTANGVVTFDPSGNMVADNCRNVIALPGGAHVFALGGGAGGNDQFWGAAVSGTNALIVGDRGGGPAAMQNAIMNDDAYVLILPLQ